MHTFAPERPGAVERTAPVWIAATSERGWLCAWDEVRERAWAVAAGAPDQVGLETGWQRDEVTVGPWRARLRRGSRKEVEVLLARWRKERPKGDPSPDHMAVPPAPAPLADGAPELPGDLAAALATVPSGIDEVWLVAVPTDATWPVHGFSGPGRVALAFACSDRRSVLFAAHPDGAPATVLPLPHGALPLDGKAWVLGGLHLRPRAPAPLIDLVDVVLAVTEPAERWALSVRQALIGGSPHRALALLDHAHRLGRSDASWPHLAQLCLALHEGPLATAAAWRALACDPELDVTALAELHTREASAVQRTMRQTRLGWPDVRRIASHIFDALAAVPDPPERLPWPPRSPRESWATALAMHGRFAEARGLWADTPPGGRRLTGIAVLAEQDGAADAASCWRKAATRLRDEGGDAIGALERAVLLAERPLDRWRWGAWAWRDGDPDAAVAQWTRAVELDEGGGVFAHAVDVPGLLRLRTLAVGLERRRLAARVAERIVTQEPAELDHRRELARILEDDGRHAEAARVVEDAARAIDEGEVPTPPEARWTLWVEAARLYELGGRPAPAVDALREALSGDFLDLEAWISALDCDVSVPPRLRSWWEHIYRVLAGEGALPGEALPPPERIDDPSLDALHPGGAGWLFELRRRLDANEPPSFTALTRGLDRLREAECTDTARIVEELSEQLELAAPPTGHVFRGVGAWGISAWPSKPPALLVGVQHLRPGERHLDEAAMRFALAAELVHLRCDHPVLIFDASWLGTSRSVYDQVNGWAGTAETVFDLVTLLPGLDQARKVQTLVKLARTAFRTRGVVDKAVNLADPVVAWLGLSAEQEERGLSREGLSGAALQFRIQAERAALLLTGDLRAAVDALLVLSTRSADKVDQVRSEGLATILRDPEGGLAGDELLRLSALVAFATSHMPWQGPPTPTDAG